MLTIKRPLLGNYRNAEFLQLMTTILEFFKSVKDKDPLLEERIAELERVIQIMKDVFLDHKADSVTAEMRPLDTDRVDTVKGLKKFLESEYYRVNPEKKNYAALLLKSLDQYCDNIARMSYQHKTAVIDKMLEEWSSNETIVNAINGLNANSWVNDVREKQSTFYNLYVAKAKASSPSLQSIKLKADIKKVFYNLIEDTNSLARVSPDKQNYINLITELNGIIDTNNAPVFNRKGRRKKVVVPPASAAPAAADSDFSDFDGF
jgi:alanyl-tRNA synthetase